MTHQHAWRAGRAYSAYNNSGNVISLEETSADYWGKVTNCPYTGPNSRDRFSAK